MQLTANLDHSSKIVGILGHPIRHSLSPMMHNRAFELLNLNTIYLPFDVPGASLKEAIKGMKALGFLGANVTIPHKERIVPYLDEVSEEASMIGAVNTITIESGKLYGYNTDVTGIYETLLDYRESLSGAEVSIFGAGGAARSLIYSLIRHFKVGRINLFNRTVQKAEELKEYFTTKMIFENIAVYELVPPDIVERLNRSKLLANTSSIGMYPSIDDSPTTIEASFNKEQIVFDVVYNPVKTKLLQLGETQGAVVLDGLKMFVEQGARAFELWTGEKMPKDDIYLTLKAELNP